MYSKSEIRDVNSSIGFSGDIEISSNKLGELNVERIHGFKEIIGSYLIIKLLVRSGLGIRVSNSGGSLDVQHVGSLVPGEGIVKNSIVKIVEHTGPVLHDEAEKGRASGASVEPDQKRIFVPFVLRLDEYVVELLSRCHIEVS